MSRKAAKEPQHPHMQANQPAGAGTQTMVAPGKRTRTMSLAAGPAAATAPVQQKPNPAGPAAARMDQAALTDQWMDTAFRPDLYPPPVQKKSTGQQPAAGAQQDTPDNASLPQPAPVIITASRLRVRSQPDTSTPDNIVGRYSRGDQVDVHGKQGGWLMVSHEGQMAYIYGKYVRPVQQTPAAPAPVAPVVESAPEAPAGSAPAAGGAEPGGSIFDPFMALARWISSIPAAFAEDDDKIAPAPANPEPALDDPKAAPANNDAPPAPSGTADLRDSTLAAYIAALNNPQADAAAHQLAALQAKYQALQSDLAITEERGKGRDELVAGIARMREMIANLDQAGLDAATLAALKPRLYRAVQDVTPNYNQGRNMDLLEGKAQAEELGTSTSVITRTCNITSLGMALEGLGKSANDYDSSKRDEIAAVAKVFSPEVASAKLTVRGDSGESFGAMAGLRLSDFLQLAAIAEVLKGGKSSDKDVKAAAVTAWGKILSIYFLQKLAKRFGASGTVKPFTLDASKSREEQNKDASKLRGWASKHRSGVEHLVDARNAMESSGTEKDQKKYEKKLKELDGAMSGKGIEERIPLESYKQAVQSQIGAELDGGAAVLVQLSGHYVRLQAIHDDHVIVDDPGRSARANRKVTWAEARAMGYFYHRLVLGG